MKSEWLKIYFVSFTLLPACGFSSRRITGEHRSPGLSSSGIRASLFFGAAPLLSGHVVHIIRFPLRVSGRSPNMWYALKVTLLDYGVVVCNSDQKSDNSTAPDVIDN
jgi:hypothetical protein